MNFPSVELQIDVPRPEPEPWCPDDALCDPFVADLDSEIITRPLEEWELHREVGRP